MKRLSILLTMLLVAGWLPIGSLSAMPRTANIHSKKAPRGTTSGIEDGWYSARVQYTNYGTGRRATYTLDVKVQYNQVVAIDFGNEGSVHSGYNNEGYIYSGGYLHFDTNYEGDIVGASATVNVNSDRQITSFVISIG